MRRSILITRFCSLLLLGVALIGCSQDEGEACQIASDCDDGLTCVRARGSERGTCVDPATIEDDDLLDAGVPDAAALPPLDASIEDLDDAGEAASDTDAG